ncbi:hypothetical protein [uncultured Gammaproteobacteria bacterium]|nr:hypothetical protein [uncultured Gammaproteobacteria bacterium]
MQAKNNKYLKSVHVEFTEKKLQQQIKQRFLSNTTFQNYDDIIERSCQAWNEILSEDGFIENLCSREWSFLV